VVTSISKRELLPSRLVSSFVVGDSNGESSARCKTQWHLRGRAQFTGFQYSDSTFLLKSDEVTPMGQVAPNRGSEVAGWRAIAAFLVLAFGWSWAFWVPKALGGLGVLDGVPVLPELGAFGPTVAAFVLVGYADGVTGVRRLLGRAVQVDYPVRWLAAALLLPVAVVATALAVAYATDTVPSYPWNGTPIVLPIAFVFVLFLGGPVQEEFGWRGYLLDPLQDHLGATVAGLAIGLVWAVWHLPLFYIPSQTIYYNIPMFGFFVSTALLSVLHTWLYNNTNRSLLPALLLHTAFNWANGMFPVLESDPASLTLLLLLAAVTVAVVTYWGPATLSRSGARSDATV
jgi:hypothetical protein